VNAFTAKRKRIPSPKEAVELLRRSGCDEGVINHCKAVAAIAKKIAETCKRKGLRVNVQLVEVGALLHDIGRSRTHHVNHVIEGAEIARSLDLPEEVISIIERHVGGGITPEEAKKLGWPAKSYVPETLEEKIVNYADKLIEGSRVVPIERTIRKFMKELGADHPSIRRIRQLHTEVSSLIGDLDIGGYSS